VAYQNGTVQACGAEAKEFISDDAYEIAEWFKVRVFTCLSGLSEFSPLCQLHCHPMHMNNSASLKDIPKLPQSVTIDTVYMDFLIYLRTCTRDFFIDSTINGSDIWDRLQNDIHLILTIPNGWDISQHTFLRTVAQRSGWVKQGKAFSNVIFVTESEASVHYTVEYQSGNWLDAGTQLLVVDAGGSTVDSTLYECVSTSPKLVLREVKPSTSILVRPAFPPGLPATDSHIAQPRRRAVYM
jgi:hypothetical protein